VTALRDASASSLASPATWMSWVTAFSGDTATVGAVRMTLQIGSHTMNALARITTVAIAGTTLRRLRTMLDQPTTAGFTAELVALHDWAGHPDRIVPASAALTSLIAARAEALGEPQLWIEAARGGLGEYAQNALVLDTLAVCGGNGDYDAFASMLSDGMLEGGLAWEQVLVDLLHLAIVLSTLDQS